MPFLFDLEMKRILLSFSFSKELNNTPAFIPVKNIDSIVRVGVTFDGIPHSTAGGSEISIKRSYKFKLVKTSRFKVLSKDGIIRIQFTSAQEAGMNFLLNDKIYYFNIVPLNDAKEDWRGQDDNIPLYAFSSR